MNVLYTVHRLTISVFLSVSKYNYAVRQINKVNHVLCLTLILSFIMVFKMID